MRKTTYFFMVFVLLVSASMVVADTGLINVKSHFNVEKTAERFVGAATEAGLKVFNRIDHAAGATEVGKRLRPAQLIIFGSPKVGTALMTSDQRVGIDLPLKVLLWQDAEDQVWLSYNSADHVFNRFAINDRPKVKSNVSGVLDKLAKQATIP
jgi:uncharacterized protein (DUF302 family)